MRHLRFILNVECSALFDADGVARLVLAKLQELETTGIECGLVADGKRLDVNIQPEEQTWQEPL